MGDYKVELGLYHDCLYEIKRRIGVIADHLNKKTTERYLIIEVETICLQFRKILEKIMLMSLVANKEAYAEQNAKFAKHYHAERIMRDLERINPDFYPVPTMLIHKENEYDEWKNIESGYLTKDELIRIYEICGGMMHAQNPFSAVKPLEELKPPDNKKTSQFQRLRGFSCICKGFLAYLFAHYLRYLQVIFR